MIEQNLATGLHDHIDGNGVVHQMPPVRRGLPPETLERMQQLRAAGMSITEIARRTGLKRQTCYARVRHIPRPSIIKMSTSGAARKLGVKTYLLDNLVLEGKVTPTLGRGGQLDWSADDIQAAKAVIQGQAGSGLP